MQVCAHPEQCKSRHDLSRISRQKGGGEISQKPGGYKVRSKVRRGQSAEWISKSILGAIDMADQSQIGFQGLTGMTMASKHTQAHTSLAGWCGWNV